MVSPFLAPRSLSSFFERVNSAYGLIRLPWRFVKIYIYPLEPREGHNRFGNQSPWSGSSDPFHRPAHSVAAYFLRLPPFSWTLRWKPFFIAWCSPVVVSSPAFYVCRTSSANWVPLFFRYSAFLYLIISSFVPFRRYAPSSPYCSHQAWDLKRGCFFLCRIPYAVPCCFHLQLTHCVTKTLHIP